MSFGAEIVAVEDAEQHRALARQNAREVKLIEHPLDPVRMLTDVLEEEDAVVHMRQMRRAREMRDHGKIATPQRTLAGEVGTVERALHRVVVVAEQAPAMVEREGRRRRGAEIGRHGTGERRHPGVRQRGELEGREIAVAEPAFTLFGNAAEIDAVEQARPAIAATRSDGDFDPGIVRHPADRREPLVVGGRKPLPARRAGGIDDHAVTERR